MSPAEREVLTALRESLRTLRDHVAGDVTSTILVDDTVRTLDDLLDTSKSKSLWLIQIGTTRNDSYGLGTTFANKIDAIKAVRQLTHLGLREAKDLVESAPCEVGVVDPDHEGVRWLERQGCTLEWRSPPS